MSGIEIAVKGSKRLESLLVDNFVAEGKGLHEKVSSIEGKLPKEIVRKIRKVATIRNKVVHEDGYDIEDLESFESDLELVESYLISKATEGTKPLKKTESSDEKDSSYFGYSGFPNGMLYFFIGFVTGIIFGYDVYQIGAGLGLSILSGIVFYFLVVFALIYLEDGLSRLTDKRFGEQYANQCFFSGLSFSALLVIGYAIFSAMNWLWNFRF